MRWSALALLAACSAPPAATPARVTAADLDTARYVEFLARYLAVDTTNPPGNEARAEALLVGELAHLGLSATVAAIAPGRTNVAAVLTPPNPDPGAGALVLLHHIDVVPSEAERWRAPPFSGERRDGALFGRGALDMKGFAALHLASLAHLVKHVERLRRPVVFLAVADEEVHGAGAQDAVRRWLPGWRAEYLLDEGGFAVRRFVEERDVVVVAIAQKRPAKLRLVARGEAGHGSRPLERGGPRVLALALARLDASPRPLVLSKTNVELLEALGGLVGGVKGLLLSHPTVPGALAILEGRIAANKNLNPVLRDTIVPTMLAAGTKPNVIPAEASAVLDVRLLESTSFDELLADLRARLADLPVELEVLEAPLPARPPAPTDDPLYAALIASLAAAAPTARTAPWTTVGATDARFFPPEVKAYGFFPVFVDKPELDGIHGHDERVSVAALEAGMVTYADALARFLLRDQK